MNRRKLIKSIPPSVVLLSGCQKNETGAATTEQEPKTTYDATTEQEPKTTYDGTTNKTDEKDEKDEKDLLIKKASSDGSKNLYIFKNITDKRLVLTELKPLNKANDRIKARSVVGYYRALWYMKPGTGRAVRADWASFLEEWVGSKLSELDERGQIYMSLENDFVDYYTKSDIPIKLSDVIEGDVDVHFRPVEKTDQGDQIVKIPNPTSIDNEDIRKVKVEGANKSEDVRIGDHVDHIKNIGYNQDLGFITADGKSGFWYYRYKITITTLEEEESFYVAAQNPPRYNLELKSATIEDESITDVTWEIEAQSMYSSQIDSSHLLLFSWDNLKDISTDHDNDAEYKDIGEQVYKVDYGYGDVKPKVGKERIGKSRENTTQNVGMGLNLPLNGAKLGLLMILNGGTGKPLPISYTEEKIEDLIS